MTNPYASPQSEANNQRTERGTFAILASGYVGAVALFSTGAALFNKSQQLLFTNIFATICVALIALPIYGLAQIPAFRKTFESARVASTLAGAVTGFSCVGAVAGFDAYNAAGIYGLWGWWAVRLVVGTCLGMVGGFCGAHLRLRSRSSRHSNLR